MISKKLLTLILLMPLPAYAWKVADKNPMDDKIEHHFRVVSEEQTQKPPSEQSKKSTLTLQPNHQKSSLQQASESPEKHKALDLFQKPPHRINTSNRHHDNEAGNIYTNTEPTFEKTLTILSNDEQAAIDYSRALELTNAGQEHKALRLLEQSLSAAPRHTATRAELARLYMKENRDLDAEIILTEGLKLTDQNSEFLKLMAIVFERRGDTSAALGYLAKIPEDQKHDKDTLALLGHIYQRLGYYARARQQYNRLTQIEPSNPLWILGHTMALDSEGKNKEALKGYHRLQSNSTLDPELMKYIEERVVALKKS